MPSPPPSWDAPSLLSGLPVTNWKKRTGAEMRGTLARCVERFLNLPRHQQQDCSLRIEGYRTLEAASIVAFVAMHGLPPSILARANNAADWLRKATTETGYDRPPSADPISLGHGSAHRKD
jgi:hypothetical protein